MKSQTCQFLKGCLWRPSYPPLRPLTAKRTQENGYLSSSDTLLFSRSLRSLCSHSLRVKGGLLTEPIATWLKLNGQHPLFLNIVEIQLQETLMHPVVNIELGFKAIDIFNCHNNFFEKGLHLIFIQIDPRTPCTSFISCVHKAIIWQPKIDYLILFLSIDGMLDALGHDLNVISELKWKNALPKIFILPLAVKFASRNHLF